MRPVSWGYSEDSCRLRGRGLVEHFAVVAQQKPTELTKALGWRQENFLQSDLIKSFVFLKSMFRNKPNKCWKLLLLRSFNILSTPCLSSFSSSDSTAMLLSVLRAMSRLLLSSSMLWPLSEMEHKLNASSQLVFGERQVMFSLEDYLFVCWSTNWWIGRPIDELVDQLVI